MIPYFEAKLTVQPFTLGLCLNGGKTTKGIGSKYNVNIKLEPPDNDSFPF